MNGPEFWNLTDDDFDLLMKVPVCGCGNPELVYAIYRAVLAATPHTGADEWVPYEERLAAEFGSPEWLLHYVVANVLDDIGATEHGGGIGGAWRTDKGERLLLLLDQYAEWDFEPSPCCRETAADGTVMPTWAPADTGKGEGA